MRCTNGCYSISHRDLKNTIGCIPIYNFLSLLSAPEHYEISNSFSNDIKEMTLWAQYHRYGCPPQAYSHKEHPVHTFLSTQTTVMRYLKNNSCSNDIKEMTLWAHYHQMDQWVPLHYYDSSCLFLVGKVKQSDFPASNWFLSHDLSFSILSTRFPWKDNYW